jgi:hypothetical protein
MTNIKWKMNNGKYLSFYFVIFDYLSFEISSKYLTNILTPPAV